MYQDQNWAALAVYDIFKSHSADISMLDVMTDYEHNVVYTAFLTILPRTTIRHILSKTDRPDLLVARVLSTVCRASQMQLIFEEMSVELKKSMFVLHRDTSFVNCVITPFELMCEFNTHPTQVKLISDHFSDLM